MRDRPEICVTNLLYRYCDLIDQARFDDLSELFGRAVVVMGGRELSGPELVDELVRTVILYDGIPRTHHLTSNVAIEVAPDGRTVTADSRFTVFQCPPGKQLQVIAVGSYHDEFASDGSGWFFTRREFAGELSGDLSGHLRSDVRPAAVEGIETSA